ncbi:restriction endonuclease subunit S [Limosilactobacillus reuteri]|uniref:restriction endonuclease subunit S n=1 Tax=Limosilactobacillus reuteri TaxID=1598 RepID=UPI0021BBAE9B|nr:restriction endonuclease subunit S [Limosilactobacillus reuteri]UXE89315.1 restriction endonuclease subunit S [Limosilactobacillus reuteri]
MTKEQNKKAPNLRFKGFTNDWEQRKLGEVIELEDNKRKPVKASKRIPGNIPYYGANGIQDYVKGYTHTGEHVLVAEDGANSISNYPVYFICSPSWINNHSHVLTGKGSIISNKFLTYNLKTVPYANYLVGSGRYKLNAETLKIIPIKLPLLTEQNYIGSTLSKIDKLITLQQRKLELLKEIKKGLLQKMFADKSKFPILRFEGFHDEWEQRKLGEVFLYKQGIQVPVEQQYSQKLPGLIRFIRISDIVSSNEPPRFINYHGTNLIKPDDLFMVRYGNPGMISMGYSGVIANNLFRLIPKKNIYTLFFYFLLIFENKRLNLLVSNTTMPALSFKALDTFYVNFPEKLSEQKVIGSLLKKLDSLITLQQRRLTKLNTIKKSLLQQMFI